MYFPELTIKDTIYNGLRIRSDGLISFKNEPFYPGHKFVVNSTKVKDKKHTPKLYFMVPRVDIGKNNIYVHILIGNAFCTNPNPDVFINLDHLDGNSLNNKASNLRWLSHSLNCINNSAKCAYYEKRNWVVTKNFRFPVKKHWYSKVGGLKRKYFSTESEAVAYSLMLKRKRFTEEYLKHITTVTPLTIYCQHMRPDLIGLKLKNCYDCYSPRTGENLLE